MKLLTKLLNKLKFDFKYKKLQFMGFDYDPTCWFILELDWGKHMSFCDRKDSHYIDEYRSFHFVIFRTCFKIRYWIDDSLSKMPELKNKGELA